MTPGARLAAAGEVLGEVIARQAAADRVLKNWGRAHRFAGSRDRAAIAERVYGVLRRLGECAEVFRSQEPRALVIGSLAVIDGLDMTQIEGLCVDGTHALGALSAQEQIALAGFRTHGSASAVLNCPAWLRPALEAQFGERMAAELAALNERAPLDLRVNSLKANRDEVLAELVAAGLPATACARAATGIRFATGSNPKVEGLACYLEGRIEIQDESSQLAITLAGAKAGEVVVDLAAGAGGKSLALAAAMGNKGRVIACDIDAARLVNLSPRAARAGVTIIDIAGDPYADDLLGSLGKGADLVFVDAPCSGSGTWRRNPESKWTLTTATLARYADAQVRLLDRARALAAPGGRIVYAVCSLLSAEGAGQAQAFCARHAGWQVVRHTFLTPLSSGTDGFFAAELCQRTL
jgi:16S rRNA (cytosine967-C5)-methyltransferase